ncbi:hypothetical protein [uncultured Clostridium sp.]|uniref:hypothetical protein n=1 Tax=uncultured Clostridium sp. TaxID=59620 RepID=UPI0026038B32|nr:hypothetical protein [uncultured Clostridium sp.]
MDFKTFISAVEGVGFPIVVAIVLVLGYLKMSKDKDKAINEKFEVQDKTIVNLKTKHTEQELRVAKLELENKEEKQLFNKAIDSFNVTIDKIANSTNRELESIKKDVEYIKEKVK